MNDETVKALMKQMPAHFADEVLEYHAAHGTAGNIAAFPMVFRFLLPAAALTAAAVFALILLPHKNDEPVQVNSHVPEITELIAVESTDTTASQTTTAEASGTTGTTGTAQTVSRSSLTTTAAHSTTAKTVQTRSANTDGNSGGAQAAVPVQTTDAETEPSAYDPHDILKQFSLGDVNMDGRITTVDGQMILKDWHNVVLDGKETAFSPEQIILADVVDGFLPYDLENPWLAPYEELKTQAPADYPLSLEDAQVIVAYYTRILSNFNMNPNPTKNDYVEFLQIYQKKFEPAVPAEYTDMLMEKTVVISEDDPAQNVNIEEFGLAPIEFSSIEHFRMKEYIFTRIGRTERFNTEVHYSASRINFPDNPYEINIEILTNNEQYIGSFGPTLHYESGIEIINGKHHSNSDQVTGRLAYTGEEPGGAEDILPTQKFWILRGVQCSGDTYINPRSEITVTNTTFEEAKAILDYFFAQSELQYEP